MKVRVLPLEPAARSQSSRISTGVERSSLRSAAPFRDGQTGKAPDSESGNLKVRTLLPEPNPGSPCAARHTGSAGYRPPDIILGKLSGRAPSSREVRLLAQTLGLVIQRKKAGRSRGSTPRPSTICARSLVDKATASEAVDRGFESRRARQI